MTEQAHTLQNSETVLKQWDERLKEVLTLSGEAQALEKGHRAKLADALEKLFELGIMLHGDPSLAEDFLTKRKVWKRRGQTDIFAALVGLSFKDTGATQRSKYAKVLKFAQSAKPKDQGLKDWLFGDESTLEARYNEAVASDQAHVEQIEGAEPRRRGRPRASISLIEDAKQRLTGHSLSSPFDMRGVDRIEGDYATVLVRKGGGGQVEIVEFVATKAAEVDKVLKKFGQRATVERADIHHLPLFRFFRAIELVHVLSVGVSANAQRRIMVATTADGGIEVYSISTKNNFRAASVTLAPEVIQLPPSSIFVLEGVSARNGDNPKEDGSEDTSSLAITDFIKSFIAKDEWTLTSTEGGVTLTTQADNLPTLKLVPFEREENLRWRVGDFTGSDQSDITLDLSYAAGFPRWVQTIRNTLASQNADSEEQENLRSMVKLNADQRTVYVTSLQLSNLRTTLFDSSYYSQPPALTDRYLSIHDFLPVCEMVKAYGLELSGGIANRDQDAAALVLSDASGQDQVKCLIPLAVSRTGHYAECCADYT